MYKKTTLERKNSFGINSSESEEDLATERTALMDGHISNSQRKQAMGDRSSQESNAGPSQRKKRSRDTPDGSNSNYGSTDPVIVPDVEVRSNRQGPRIRDRQAAPNQNNSDQIEDDEEGLKYGAQHVIKLFAPVTLCMLVVVVTIRNVQFYNVKDQYLLYTPFHETSPDPGTKFWNAIANAGILMVFIIIMTVLLIVLYKKRCYRIINIWLISSSLLLLFIFSYLYMEELLRSYNIAMDFFTAFIFMWNFGVVGMMAIHWHAPLKLQQGYLIFIAALMALVFIKYLPEWTTWVVLAAISIWDLVAVLTPHGPLRILVETAQERNEQIFPALIYSSTVLYTFMGTHFPENSQERPLNTGEQTRPRSNGRSNRRSEESSQQTQDSEAGFNSGWSASADERVARRQLEVQANNYDNANRSTEYRTITAQNTTDPHEQFVPEEERGIKLGLGDFIFYSVLVGKASSYGDWNTTIACFLAILIGLCLTLLLLAVYRKALPALPISITFGLIFYFATSAVVKPFTGQLAGEQVFI